MAAAVWNYPTRILFGDGAVSDVGAEAQKLGMTRALIVSDPGVTRAGLLEPIERSLKAQRIEAVRFDAISTNPSEAEAKVEGGAGN